MNRGIVDIAKLVVLFLKSYLSVVCEFTARNYAISIDCQFFDQSFSIRTFRWVRLIQRGRHA